MSAVIVRGNRFLWIGEKFRKKETELKMKPYLTSVCFPRNRIWKENPILPRKINWKNKHRSQRVNKFEM